MRILIAEDERITRRGLQRQLEQWGHEVVATADGQEAWEAFAAEPFPMVISDWEMPELNGVELVRRIRSTDSPGYVYFILLTAKSDKQDIVEGMEAGADDFVSKPFDRNELRVRVRAGQRIVDLEQSLAQRNHRMQRDLEAAAELQQSLLPTSLPEVDGLNFAWSFMPCDELAGDFLGLFQLDENHIGFYVVDVSGHGVAASLMAVSISRALAPNSSLSSSLLLQADGSFEDQVRSPADVAKELNVRFPIEECGGKFFTMVYGVLNIITQEVRYVSAGHPPMIQSSGWQPPEMLAAEGFMVGVVDGIDFEERRVQLKSGDRLYLYSDGLVEQFNTEGTQFGNDRLCANITESHSMPLAESVDALQQAVVQWNAGGQLHDDLSILAVEVQ
jgi:sigma-B regulation protein RsbU (phosphoserine phosphatase)